MTYEGAKARAEEIIRKIESGDIDLDQLVAELKECRELLRLCHEKIYRVDTEVRKILDDSEEN